MCAGRRGPEVVFWETEPIPPLTRRSRPFGLPAPARHKRWVAVKLRFSPPETSPVFRSDELVRSPKKHLATDELLPTFLIPFRHGPFRGIGLCASSASRREFASLKLPPNPEPVELNRVAVSAARCVGQPSTPA